MKHRKHEHPHDQRIQTTPGWCWWLQVILIWCFASWASATSLTISDRQLSYELGYSLHYLVDAQHGYSLEALAHSERISWLPVNARVANFGFSRQPYWLAFDFTTAQIQHRDWLLELAYPLLDDIQVYVFHNGLRTHY